MRNIATILGILVLCGLTPALGADVCTRQAYTAADNGLDSILSWKDLHAAFRKYRQCDDGALSEGYSEIVARLLADDWNRLYEFLAIARTDDAFETWAISHLDDTDSNDDLVKIEGLARMACPKGAEGLCHRIRLHLRSMECLPEFPAGAGCVASRHPL